MAAPFVVPLWDNSSHENQHWNYCVCHGDDDYEWRTLLYKLGRLLLKQNDGTVLLLSGCALGFLLGMLQNKITSLFQKTKLTTSCLQSNCNTHDHSTRTKLPKHIAVIMDGNRRYGRLHYPQNPLQGHVKGAQKLSEMISWCVKRRLPILTVYCFSTENWNRPPEEVQGLWDLMLRQSRHDLLQQARQDQIRITVISTQWERIPAEVQEALQHLQDETAHHAGGLQLNLLVSYGSRGEVVEACRRQLDQRLPEITEATFEQHLSLPPPFPDVVIRTSGERRLSNCLLWQCAYAEWFFVDTLWPDFQEQEFDDILQHYAQQRQRRFGK